MWLTIHYLRQQFIMREVGVSVQTVVDLSSFCRDVCVYWLQWFQVLDGPGVVVETDEAKIGRRKYNRGRWVNGNWIFGGTERGTGRCFIVPVQNHGSDTLLRVIQNWIRPGTTITPDCWKAYDCLSDEGFVHQTVTTPKISSILVLPRTSNIFSVCGGRCAATFIASVEKSLTWSVI